MNLFKKVLRKICYFAKSAPPPQFVRVAYCMPRQVVLVTTRYNGADNIWPMDLHTLLSFKPKLYCISLTTTSYGAELIRKSNVFTLNFVPATMEEKILFLGNTSGRNTDKFLAAGLGKEQAKTIDVPRLPNTLGFLECKVQQILDVGDHTLFIAEVTYEEFHGNDPQLYHLDGSLDAQKKDYEKNG
ncbi:MAG TPA: flavin reductase family protein [Candidatus Kapabacteria bacterium]|nr:flavin reductase family protein [Candidatus Kapabacteria bacterium]